MSKQKQKNNFCTQLVLNLYFSGNSMNNLSSYCGLTDSRMRASDIDLPVSTLNSLFNGAKINTNNTGDRFTFQIKKGLLNSPWYHQWRSDTFFNS